MMLCPKCGNEIDVGAKFCTYCGNRIEQQPAPKPKKNKKLWIILIAVISVLLLVGAAVFAVVKLVDSVKDSLYEASEELTDRDEEDDFEEDEDEQEDNREQEETLTETLPVEEETVPALEETEPATEYTEQPVTEEVPTEAVEEIPTEVEEEVPAEATEPIVMTAKDWVSDKSIVPLIERARELRAEADAKWDQVKEIPGECEYKGYIYMEDPDDGDNNRLYLVFVMNAEIKGTPIQFIYWVYYDDIALDEQGNVVYDDMYSSRDDGYTVDTAFGSYYSYYGLDDYPMFEEKIIGKAKPYKVAKKDLSEIVIEHPVADTYK